MLLDSIAEITDYNQKEFVRDQILAELRAKFLNSIVLVDKKPYRLHDISDASITCNNGKIVRFTINENHTIEKFLPKTGLYEIDNEVFYLHRIPFKQWTKSFSLGNNYKAIPLTNINTAIIEMGFLNETAKFLGKQAIVNEKVFLHWKHIGYLSPYKYTIVLKPMYENIKPLVESLWKQYQVIMEQHNQKKEQVGKLLLDF